MRTSMPSLLSSQAWTPTSPFALWLLLGPGRRVGRRAVGRVYSPTPPWGLPELAPLLALLLALLLIPLLAPPFLTLLLTPFCL